METESTFRVAFWVLFAALLIIRLYSAVRVRWSGERLLPDRKAVEREGRWAFAGRVVGFLVLLGVLALYAVAPPWLAALAVPFPGWLRWAGFVLGVLSLALLAWVQQTLGRQWSPQLQLRQRHGLVTSGPYARVRHPMYTAMVGLGVAFALLTANWLFVAFWAVVCLGLLARIPREERMMVDEFGEAYREYVQRTGRLLPR